MAAGTLAALLLAAAAPPAAERAALDAAVATIYRPYATPDGMDPMWEYPVYSARTTALIAQWRRVAPEEEPDDLSDGDWFCQCQDWLNLRARVTAREMIGPNRASLRVRIDIGGAVRDARMVFVRERGRWKLDDLFAAPSMPRGLRQALRETIAADIKLKTRQ